MPMNSVVPATDGDPINKEVIEANRSAELLAAATEGRGDEVVQILEGDLELIRVGDTVGDTALHLLVRANYVEALCLLIRWFLQGKHYELLKEVAKQGNGDGDTPLHLAIKNMSKVAFLLYKVAPMARFIHNDDGKSPIGLAIEATGGDECFTKYDDSLLELKPVLDMVDHLFHPKNCRRIRVLMAVDIEMRIEADRVLEMLEADINLIHNMHGRGGNTILHKVAWSGDMDVLHKLISFLTTNNDNDHRLRLLLECNSSGDTPFHLAVKRRHTTVARYLMDLAPETAYQVNRGVSPLHLALEQSWDDFVKYMLEVMPEASISPVVIKTLLAPSKASLPHTAIRKRDLTMLKTMLDSIPSLIYSSDEKGWKPLSYAAYKGYLEEVRYLLNQFPQSADKFDSDGSFPIHKAVSGGHISIIKEFVSLHPQTLYAVDKKGRTILHIAVRYAKADVLSYLARDCSDIQELFDSKDSDGKTCGFGQVVET